MRGVRVRALRRWALAQKPVPGWTFNRYWRRVKKGWARSGVARPPRG
jgi:hypothetical protein